MVDVLSPAEDTTTDRVLPSRSVAATRPRSRTGLVALAVFVVTFLVYWASPVRMVTDSFWTVYTARSLVKDGDLDLREYRPYTDTVNAFQIEDDGAARYYRVPLVATLTNVPAVALMSLIDGPGLDRSLGDRHTQPADGLAAAFVAALTAALLFVVVRRLTPKVWIALATTGVYAFGTQAWSTASRTTWMHGPSMLFLTAALYCALRARTSARWFPALGAALTLAYFARPTNAVPLLVFGVWVLLQGRHAATRFVAGVLTVTAIVVGLDLSFYGHAFQPYFGANRLGLSSVTVEALLGNLISPARGLFVFVPVTLLCGFGFVVKRRTGSLDRLDVVVAVSVVGYWIAVSLFPKWYAGYSFGPRFLADVAPLMVWFLPPVFAWLVDAGRPRRVAPYIAVALLIAASVAIQARGALVRETAEWNWTPHDIDLSPGRVWDWSDPQFLR